MDRASTLCKVWLARDDRYRALLRRWGDVEAALALSHGWYRLTSEERTAVAQAAELRRLDAEMDSLGPKRDRLTARIIAAPATTVEAVILKLAVAAALVPPEENEDGHRLVASASRDLARL